MRLLIPQGLKAVKSHGEQTQDNHDNEFRKQQ